MSAWPGWEVELLAALSAPDTAANRKWLDTWHSFEQSGAKNNPLNTTQPWPLATDYNSAGVKNYPSHAAGIAATVETLRNGRYDAILAALETGNPATFQPDVTLAAELRVWGSVSFADTIAMSAATPQPGSTAALTAAGVAPSGHAGWGDVRNSVNRHLPTQLARSQALRHAALRELSSRPRLGR